eukprot:1337523-Ditylum_brightwellii.AAC.1
MKRIYIIFFFIVTNIVPWCRTSLVQHQMLYLYNRKGKAKLLKEEVRAKTAKEATSNAEEDTQKTMKEKDADFCHQDTGISCLALQQTMERHGSFNELMQNVNMMLMRNNMINESVSLTKAQIIHTKRESVDAPVPTVAFDKEHLMLFYPTSLQTIGLGGDLFFGYVPDKDYGIPIPPITMMFHMTKQHNT